MNFQLNEAIEILSRTPSVVRAMLWDLPDSWTGAKTEAEGWTIFDVIGHLIHGEQTDWMPRLHIILEHGKEKPFEPFDRFAQFEKSKGKTLHELLEEFARLRAENLRDLQALSLTEEQLNLRGTHPELGQVTVRQLLATWLVHDFTHLAQIVRVAAKRYGEEVGPWREYLGVLKR